MGTDKINKKLYKVIDVWKKYSDKCAVRYWCFEILGESRYCVQSCDYFYYPVDKKQIQISDSQFVELFIESLPEDRTETYSTLDEAIRMHEKEFTEP